jgi:hypothetical protein
MVERAVLRCHASLANVQFESALDPVRVRKMYGLIAGAVLVPLVLAAIFPANAGLWARRLFLASIEPWPQNTYIEVADVHDGRIAVPRGEPYALRAWAKPKSTPPDRINLTIRSAGKTTVLMKEFAKNDFRHDFAIVDQPLKLELQGGDDECGPIELSPVDRPRIAALELISQHPRQNVAEKHTFAGSDADLNFLPKTRLALNITANVPLKELRLKPSTAQPTAANVRRIDATRYTIEWTQEAPARFDLELVAEESGLVSMPAPVSIGLKMDQVPRVTLAYSGVHPRITPQARIPLTIEGRDDYGMIGMALAMKDETPDPADAAKLVPRESSRTLFPYAAATQAGTTQPATQASSLETELQLKQIVDVAAMKLPAGALLSLTAQATDDCYMGRQTGRSRTVTFRLVPPEELFREILQRQQGERIKFRKQIEEAQKIRDGIRVVADSRQAADLTRRHRSFQRETLRIATVMTEALVEIKLNGLGSPESHAIMEQNILLPMKAMQDELVSPQTPALDTLFPAEGAANPANVLAAAEREEQIVARMNILLKQMAQWDSFVDVLNQLDAIIKLETQVKDQSEKIKKTEDRGIFDK